MGAGPTKRQITDGTRKALQRVAKEYGAEYVRARRLAVWPHTNTPAHVVKLAKAESSEETYILWTLKTRLLRASNGEAALMFIAETPRGGFVENICSAEALKAIGVEKPKPQMSYMQRQSAAVDFVRRIASYGYYIAPESGSWSESQAEDALAVLNGAIANARDIFPDVLQARHVVSDDEAGEGEKWEAFGLNGNVEPPEADE